MQCFITQKFVIEALERKKQVFLQSFNIRGCMVVGLFMAEGLFSLKRDGKVPSSPNHLFVILLKANKIFLWDPSFPVTQGVGVVIMGCLESKSFCLWGWVKYISCYNFFFLQFLYYRRWNKHLKRLCLCSLVVLLRGNNSYMESIVGSCFSRNQKQIFAVWVWFWRKFWKRLRQWKKSIHEQKAEFV